MNLKIIITILLTSFIIIFLFLRISMTQNLVLPIPLSSKSLIIEKSPPLEFKIKDLRNEELSNLILEIIKDKKGYFAIFVKNLKGDERFYLNEKEEFGSASLYKLEVLVEGFSKRETGEIKFEDTLKINLDIDGNIVGKDSDNISQTLNYSIGELLERMIIFSDNLSGQTLGEYFGWEKIVKTVAEIGLRDTKLTSPPKTTAEDMATLLEGLYFGKIISKEASSTMIDLLLRQEIHNKLPSKLPTGVKIAHKTGELDNLNHDVGIVFGPKTDYLIVVLVKDVPFLGDNDLVIADISKAGYDFFNR